MHVQGSAIDHHEYLKTKNFAALDGLRAISVFLVYSAHFGGPDWARMYGWLGVYAFFALSGFLITTLLLRERDGRGGVSLNAFYLRRATRILPLYLLVYCVVLSLSFLAGGTPWAQMKAATPYYLSFLNEYAAFAPLHMTWTLGVEWKYYLVWPVLFALFGVTASSRAWLAIVSLALLLATWHLRPAWFAPWYYFGMLAGAAVAIALNAAASFARLRGLMTNRAAFMLVLALLVLHRKAALVAAHLGEPQMIALYTLLVALLLPSLVANRALRRLLSNRGLVFVGRRSYAVYLVQYLAADAVLGLLPGVVASPLLLALSFVVALIASDILYRWFEKPIVGWGQRRAAAIQRPVPLSAPPEAAVVSSNWRPLL